MILDAALWIGRGYSLNASDPAERARC